ncbi:hypothetical protein [Paraflavitalea speifideaquila]|uniref:hypothetical protein n=1 Tax=Paraflavitalea speifideaquila TaxID=3076558 RepID=UPI0028E98B86|nr:hypothetical protein [Paraflavitalea speifideiaquila]
MADNSINPLAEYENLIQNGGIERLYDRFLTDRDFLAGSFTTDANDTFAFPEQDEFGEWYFTTESFQDRVNVAFKNAYRSSTHALSNQLASVVTN